MGYWFGYEGGAVVVVLPSLLLRKTSALLSHSVYSCSVMENGCMILLLVGDATGELFVHGVGSSSGFLVWAKIQNGEGWGVPLLVGLGMKWQWVVAAVVVVPVAVVVVSLLPRFLLVLTALVGRDSVRVVVDGSRLLTIGVEKSSLVGFVDSVQNCSN